MHMARPPRKPRREAFSHQVLVFIEALIASPNVTRAYLAAYPGCKPQSAAVSGQRLLRNAKVAEAVKEGRARRLRELGMDADEAMQRIAIIGKLDVRQLFDHEGKMLPVQDWPDEVALVVKGLEEKELGTKVSFDSRLAALELIAVAGGKLAAKKELQVDVLALLLEHATPEDKVPAKGKGK
jgi:hypothetical protein